MDIDMTKMRKELIDDESLKPRAYKDNSGYLTIGVGRLIDPRKPGGLSPEECVYLLNNDIQKAVSQVSTLPCWSRLSDNQRRGLVNMCFQLGWAGLQKFDTFLSLMDQGRYKEAGDDLKGTKWHQETTARAERVIKLLS